MFSIDGMTNVIELLTKVAKMVIYILLAGGLAAISGLAISLSGLSVFGGFSKIDGDTEINTRQSGFAIVDELVSSRAHVDAYAVFKKSKSTYFSTDESLEKIAHLKLSDDDGNNDRQLCINSISITFGYRNITDYAFKVLDSKEDQMPKIQLPTILGRHITDRFTAPNAKTLTSACQSFFLRSDGMQKVIRDMRDNKSYRIHMLQGIDALYRYMVSISSEEDIGKAEKWKEMAIQEYENAVRGPIRRMSAPMSSAGLPGYSDNDSADSYTLSTYKETYSSMAYSSANKTTLIVLKSEGFAVQQEVVEVAYGIDVIGKEISSANTDTLIASPPRIVYMNTLSSELAIFNDPVPLTELLKMPVEKYFAQQIRQNLDSAIQSNSQLASKLARQAFERRILANAKQNNRRVAVRFTDSQPAPESRLDTLVKKLTL